MKLNFSTPVLAEILQAQMRGVLVERNLQEVAYDTRKIQQGHDVLFFALKGIKQNGFEYLSNAYQKGVRHFVVDQHPKELLTDATYFIVKDGLTAMQSLATYHRKRIKYPILAITGAIGKTTVKEWIAHLIGEQLKVYRSPKSYNSQLGVALSLLSLPIDGELAIIEAAITKPGEMERLQAMIQPNYCSISFVYFVHRLCTYT
jgi:Alr-MurF fusion protein